jgi:CheY-like chemotaxis protein
VSLAVSARPGGLHTASIRLPLALTDVPSAEPADIAELLPEEAAEMMGSIEELIAPADLPAHEVADLLDVLDDVPAAPLALIEVDDPPPRSEREETLAPAMGHPSTGEEAAPAPSAPPGHPASPDLPGAAPDLLRVLAVDDNEDNRTLLQRMAGDDLRLEVVATARQALMQMAKAQYDVLLLDINLGRNQSGADVLRIARTLPGYADVYAIAFTAHDGPEQRARFAAAGFDAHLSKPFSRDSLREVMAGAVGA